jgi:acyl-coenzyme A thioesterase PaaI-like protein
MIKQPTSRTCFLCGRENPIGLKMEWYNDSEHNQIIGKITIPEHFNGYPGIVHGGIIAAVLDETAGRAVLLDGDFENLFVTLKLDVTYRNFTPTNTPLTAVGWITRRDKVRCLVAAELRLPDGTITTECKAVVVRPPEEIMKRWAPEKTFWKVNPD